MLFSGIAVADFDQVIEEISRRDIASAPIEIVESAGRKAAFTDLEGNMLTYIEVQRTGVQVPDVR